MELLVSTKSLSEISLGMCCGEHKCSYAAAWASSGAAECRHFNHKQSLRIIPGNHVVVGIGLYLQHRVEQPDARKIFGARLCGELPQRAAQLIAACKHTLYRSGASLEIRLWWKSVVLSPPASSPSSAGSAPSAAASSSTGSRAAAAGGGRWSRSLDRPSLLTATNFRPCRWITLRQRLTCCGARSSAPTGTPSFLSRFRPRSVAHTAASAAVSAGVSAAGAGGDRGGESSGCCCGSGSGSGCGCSAMLARAGRGRSALLLATAGS